MAWDGFSRIWNGRFGRAKTAPVLKILMIPFDVVCCLQDSAHVAQSATESMAGDVSTALVALAPPNWLKKKLGGFGMLRAFPFPSLVLLGLFCQTITGLVNMSSLPARRAALVDTGCSARKIMKSRAGGPWHPMAMEPLGEPLTDFLEMGR